ncbi:hypothetical protein bwei_0537 [Bacillus mycoides]|nr:hypothetical protein bwei_0537 [Bacillus mycoides]EEL04303.1 hypothetical protein bcere0014_41270 [Bacillus cereus BDRD-ST196]
MYRKSYIIPKNTYFKQGKNNVKPDLFLTYTFKKEDLENLAD